MILGIITDTHDNMNRIPDGVAVLYEHSPDLIVHAGDFISPFTARCFEPVREQGIPFLGIFGNNDGERFFLRKMYDHIGPIHEDPHPFSLGDRRILVTHKELLVDALAASGSYDVVIYGHTHKIDVRTDPCLIVNPGEGGGWLTGKCTLAIVDLSTLQAQIIEF